MNSRGWRFPAAAFSLKTHLAHVPLRGGSVSCHLLGGASSLVHMASQPPALRLAFGLVPAVRVHDETALPIIESEFLQSNNRGVVHLSLGWPFAFIAKTSAFGDGLND